MLLFFVNRMLPLIVKLSIHVLFVYCPLMFSCIGIVVRYYGTRLSKPGWQVIFEKVERSCVPKRYYYAFPKFVRISRAI